MRWRPDASSCVDCGFSWSVPVGEAVAVVTDVPAHVSTALDRAGSAATITPAPGVWSASGYAWHLVDVLRIGAERLWTIAYDPGAGLPGWDENALAAARHYDDLSPVVAGRALRDAAATWLAAARAVAPEATIEHREDGTLTAGDVIRRNAHEARHHLLDIERGTPP